MLGEGVLAVFFAIFAGALLIISLDNFDFIAQKDSDVVYKIDVPILTHRETLALNQILFDTDKEKKFIEAKIITEKELTEYKKIYKYCPSFHDVRI